jgi:hypothetical protein
MAELNLVTAEESATAGNVCGEKYTAVPYDDG